MDFLTQLITGVLCCVVGMYIFIYGYRTAILRKAEIVFPMQLEIWIARTLRGAAVAERFKSRFLKPKYLLYNGISSLIIGAITFVLGVLLLLDL